MLVVILVLIVVIVLVSIGQMLQKKGMNALGKDAYKERGIFGVIFYPPVLTGIILYAISAFLWLFLLGRLDISKVYPLISLSYVVTAFLAIFFLNEKVTYMRWLAIALILAGSFVMLKT